MSYKVEQFSSEIRGDIAAAHNRLQFVEAQLAHVEQESRDDIRAKLIRARADLQDQARKAEEERRRVRAYHEERFSEKQQEVDDWRSRRQVRKLEERAEHREACAAACVAFALAVIDEAHVAILEAIESRVDAEEAKAALA